MKRKELHDGSLTPGLSYKDFNFEVKDITEKGNFIGYGSVFNNVDYGSDIVIPGAFSKTIAMLEKTGRKLPILYQHRSAEPLGVYDSQKEDDIGLLMTGTLLVGEVQRAKETHALMRVKAITGMSIGYKPVVESYDSKAGINSLIEVDLRETSLVTFPMNDLARVQDVKSNKLFAAMIAKGQLPTLPEFENFLCEAGFSRTQAKAIAGSGLRKLHDRREVDSNASAMLEALEAWKF